MRHQVKYDYLGNTPKPHFSLGGMIEANRKADYHFLDRETMRFFNSRVEEVHHLTPAETTRVLFITSESYGRYDNEPPRFTVREFFPATGRVATIGEFMEHVTLSSARNAIQDIFWRQIRNKGESA